ncbi:hypothetical protein CVD25_00585 [Bacillus canaveralius]|uniref:Uncharacterized protein n=1 Tax=Bacillus canaveralius TaxID=1403243 RepID=A0A2N5GFW1_9BACI|nr:MULTISPECIES: hypothetical protein [Bacillus]PLR79654.1 hypothetical protein CU635_21865 [Bacillus canaveralius]PLR80858.1 hypothetical protein CVD23_20245 [Bacillus sp. V33-4]PLS00845.1 hypothetical protein CVD25_00585 [Bacillus canaveralius]RSK53807.1 hypothetical protein EJA13_07375 [Bacillus canaveralius]
MQKFQLSYYFEGDLSVARVIEAEDQAEAIQQLKDNTGLIEFTDSEDTYHFFDTKDVKLFSVKKIL